MENYINITSGNQKRLKKEIFFLAEAINVGKYLIFIANHYREINFLKASLPYAHNGFYLVEQFIKCVDYRNLILKTETQAKANIVSLILGWIHPSRWRWFGILIKSQNIKNARNYEFSKKHKSPRTMRQLGFPRNLLEKWIIQASSWLVSLLTESN